MSPEPPGRPAPLRVLAILNGPTPDMVLNVDQRELGPLEELADLPNDFVEVCASSPAGLRVLPWGRKGGGAAARGCCLLVPAVGTGNGGCAAC